MATKKITMVPLNDLQPFRGGGGIKKKGLPAQLGPGVRPERLIPLRGKTLSRKADEVPVRSRKVNRYNFKKGRPFNKIERLKRKFFQGGGVLPQDTTDSRRLTAPPQEVVGPPEGDIDFETDFQPVAYDPSEYEQFQRENYVPFSDHPEARNIDGVPVANPPYDPRTRQRRYQDGGVILKPSDVRQNLPQLSNEQLAELSTQMFQGQQQGVVSDTIQYNIPEYDPTLAGSQQRVPIEFTTPNLDFETEGIPRGVPADRRQAPILGGRRRGGRMKKGCGGKIKR